MLVCSYANGSGRRYGRVDQDPAGDSVVPVEYDSHARRWVRLGEPARPLSALTLLPPAEPSKILCIALNHGPGARVAGARPPSC